MTILYSINKADLQKVYERAQGKYDETVTIASRFLQISRKLQAWKMKTPPPGVNIAPG